jgi:hypothetical protein
MSIPITGKIIIQFENAEDMCEFSNQFNKNTRVRNEKILCDLRLENVELQAVATRDDIISNKQVLQIKAGNTSILSNAELIRLAGA